MIKTISRLCFLTLFIPLMVEAEEVEINLSLECHTVPNKKEQLCLAITQSPVGPVDDVVFYHKRSDGNLTFIKSYKGDIALLYFYRFSINGKLLVLGYAEEGHPGFYFHDTQKYLAGEKSSIGFISKYEYTHFEKVSDNGDIVIGVMEGFIKDTSVCLSKAELGNIDDNNECHIKHNIYQNPEVF